VAIGAEEIAFPSERVTHAGEYFACNPRPRNTMSRISSSVGVLITLLGAMILLKRIEEWRKHSACGACQIQAGAYATIT
jgi:hypothetical protein